MAEGIRIGGAFYEIVLSDEAMRAQFENARSEAQRLAVALAAALNIRVTGGQELGRYGQMIRQISESVAQTGGASASLQNVITILNQMGMSQREALDAMREYGVVAQQSSQRVVQALTEEARAKEQLRRLDERANRDLETRRTADAQRQALPQTEAQSGAIEARFRRMQEAQGTTAQIPSDLIRYNTATGRYHYTAAGAQQLGGNRGAFVPPEVVGEQARLAQIQQPADTARVGALRDQQQRQMDAILATATRDAEREQEAARRRQEQQSRAANQLNAQRNRALESEQRDNDRQERAAMRLSQTRAENAARAEGAAYSTMSGRLVAPRGFTVDQGMRGPYQRPGGELGANLAATGEGAGGAGFFGRALNLSPSNLLRGGAALVGIPFGISILASALRDVHQIIQDVVEGQLNWERSLKNVSALYGQAGSQLVTIAQTQARVPGQLGTQEEYLRGQLAAAPLRDRYGMGQGQLTQVSSAAYQRFTALGVTDQAQREKEMRAIWSSIQTGAELPPEYGIYLDPTALARRVGVPGGQGIQQLTAPQQQQLRAAVTAGDMAKQAQQANENRRALLDTNVALQAQADRTRTELQTAVENLGNEPRYAIGLPSTQPPGAGPRVGAGSGRGATGGQFGAGSLFGRPTGEAPTGPGGQMADLQAASARRLAELTAAEQAARQAVEDNRVQVEANTQKLIESARIQADAQQVLENFSKSAEGAAARLAAWAGDVEDARSVTHIDQIVAASADAARRATGGVPTIALTQEQIARTARETAVQQAYEQFYAGPQAAKSLDENDPLYRTLLEVSQGRPSPGGREGPPSPDEMARAQQGLNAIPRFQAAQQQIGVIGQAGAFVDIAQQQASNALTRIQNQEAQRLRDRVEEITAARQNELNAQATLAPLMLQEMDAQQAITVASRENLDLKERTLAAESAILPARQQIARLEQQISQQVDHQAQVRLAQATFEAQQGLVGPQRALEDTQYQIRLLGQQYAASVVSQMGGGPATVDPAQTIMRIRELAMQSITQQVPVTEAQRGVTEAERAQQDEAARTQRQQFPLQAQMAAQQDAIKEQEAAVLSLQQQEEAERLTIEQRLVPLQRAKQLLDDQVFTATRALTVAQQTQQQIQREVELLNLADAKVIAYWQTQLSGASTLKTYLSDAATSAILWANQVESAKDAMVIAANMYKAISDIQKDLLTGGGTRGPADPDLTRHLGGAGPAPNATVAGAGDVNFNGPVVINNMDDIERIAADAASQAGQNAYNRVKASLIRAYNTAQPSLPPSIPGAQSP